MLGLNTDLSLEIKHAKFPVTFKHKNVCIHCGAENELVFVDKFGRETTGDAGSAFEHIKCKKCGRLYSMRWEPDEKDPSVYKPSAVEFNIKQDFINLIDQEIRYRGEKVLD